MATATITLTDTPDGVRVSVSLLPLADDNSEAHIAAVQMLQAVFGEQFDQALAKETGNG